MDTRSLGLILVWIGSILLVAVLQHRIRKGALGEQALEEAPPVERWSKVIAIAGMVLAMGGMGLTLASWL